MSVSSPLPNALEDRLNKSLGEVVAVKDFKPKRIRGMRSARESVVQAIYPRILNRGGVPTPANRYETTPQVDKEFVCTLLDYIDDNFSYIKKIITGLLRNYSFVRVAAVDRCILFTAIAELKSRKDTPAAVIIDEAIELGKAFGSEKSAKFINGILGSFVDIYMDGIDDKKQRQKSATNQVKATTAGGNF